MAEFSSHIPGTVCWVEAACSDRKGAVAFYQSLFGWGLIDQPIGPDDVYSLLTVRGKEVAAAYQMPPPEQRKRHEPPHWNIYFAVASADEAATRASGLGAEVLAPPFDVMDLGRMAVLQDPAGAVFQIWEARKQTGVKIMYEPGALCWSELTTRDTKVAEAFYTELFGWTAKHNAPAAVMEYTEFSVNGQPSIGMLAMPPDMPAHVPSFWTPYLQVPDADASAAKAKELGGNVMVPPRDIPDAGRFAIVQDPQRAMFGVFKFTGA